VLSCDPDATRQAYSGVKWGGAESCPCTSCKNYVLVRDIAYPKEAMDLFGQFGIDYHKEAEVYRWWREPQGLHWYQGWFHFVGFIVSGKDAESIVGLDHKGEPYGKIDLKPITDNFSIGFTKRAELVDPAFRTGKPITQIDFSTKIPWMLSTPEPAVWD
jgi:hypothetical protein